MRSKCRAHHAQVRGIIRLEEEARVRHPKTANGHDRSRRERAGRREYAVACVAQKRDGDDAEAATAEQADQETDNSPVEQYLQIGVVGMCGDEIPYSKDLPAASMPNGLQTGWL